ncbi:MAG: hypothetical protein EAZ85_00005 [Bacteroidetes bacterium]|nr:MAG: hypothetical protein EAZ85_00005 [Bacteroidota bacterium]
MKKPHYLFEEKGSFKYSFESVGLQTITKIVEFQPITYSIYNLAFGDFDEINQNYDDEIRSNNQDIHKIFATIFQICNHFFIQNTDKAIYLEGNTPLKQKLYQRIIKNNLSDLENNFIIFGVIGEEYEILDFSKIYDAFVIKLKK